MTKFKYGVRKLEPNVWVVFDKKTDAVVRSFYSRETARAGAKEMNAIAIEQNVAAA